MTRQLIQIVCSIALLAAGVGGLNVLSTLRAEPEVEERPETPPMVEIDRVEPVGQRGFSIQVNGTVVPTRELSLNAEVAGRVIFKAELARAGKSVHKGDLLLRIDPSDYETAVEVLDSQIAQLEVDLEQIDVQEQNNRELITIAEQDLTVARRERDRLRNLSGRGAISAGDVDQADSSLLASRRQYQSLINEQRIFDSRRRGLEARRRLLIAQTEQARRDLARTEIRSPIDGIIVEEIVEQDAYVKAGDVLLLMEDTSVAEVRCFLRMDDLYWLLEADGQGDVNTVVSPDGFEGQLPQSRAQVTYELAGRTYNWRGALARYESGGIDSQTRTLPVRLVVPDPGQGALRLRRGMFVEVELFVDDLPTPLVTVPSQALRPNNDLWVVGTENELVCYTVDPIRTVAGRILLRGDDPDAPISAGDRVVVSPLPGVLEGTEVSPIPIGGPNPVIADQANAPSDPAQRLGAVLDEPKAPVTAESEEVAR